MVAKRAFGIVGLFLIGCASSGPPQEQRYTIIRPPETVAETKGIPPDKEAEIQLLLQQRQPSAAKCYQDVLNEKQDRTLQGSVKVVITIQPSGQASQVEVVGGSLTDAAVRTCLVETIQRFEFPQLTQSGQVQYEYAFRPAY
jgi:TonB family protein